MARSSWWMGVMGAALGGLVLPLGAQPAAKGFDPDQRVLWTTSRLVGTPEPSLPFRLRRDFPALQFRNPVDFSPLPTTDRLVIVEKSGNLYSFSGNQAVEKPDLFFALRELVPELLDVYGITFDPDFPRNRFVYLCYVLKGNLPEGTRVSRFRVTAEDPPQIDPASEELLITWPGGGHNGGCLKFGLDGYLYITSGDGRGPNPPDQLRTGQDCSDLLSSVLRIDVHPSGGDLEYAIPADNPFVGMAGVRPEIWSFGFRNPWKMSVDPATGDLWIGDVGWDLWELVFKVERGANYGWSIMEGSQPIHPDDPLGPAPISPPTAQHPHSEARSITGGYVYRGRKFPDLKGAYIYGDYETGKIWALRQEPVADGHAPTPQEIADSRLRIITFGEDHDRELVVVDYGGAIYRFEKTEPAREEPPPFPQKLSETGLFSSVADHAPAPGVIPYSVNVERWADGASSERLLGLPGESRIDPGDSRASPNAEWNLPIHAVVAKTYGLEMEAGAPESRRRIETQILHRHPEGWRAYTYAWNEEGSDAELVSKDGAQREFTIRDRSAPGGERRQTWEFLSRANCYSCHNGRGGTTRAIGATQWSRAHRYGTVVDDQLSTLTRLGVFARPVEVATAPLLAPHEASANLEDRARIYLHYNCSFCHRPNGGGLVPLHFGRGQAWPALGVGQAPQRGDFGIEDARVIAPGRPLNSTLYFRMAKLGSGRMPHLGSALVDAEGLELIYEWIRTMPRPDDRWEVAIARIAAAESGELRQTLVLELVATAEGALALMRSLDRNPELSGHRAEIAGCVAASAVPAHVRDLFDRFLPAALRRRPAIQDPQKILALEGDVERGRARFEEGKAAACLACHLLDGVGKDFGPSLSGVGTRLSGPQILESLLDPDKTITEGYAGYTATRSDGTVLVGRLVSRTPEKVVIRDLTAQDHVLNGGHLQRLDRLSQSLMPAGLVSDLSDQELADLVAYLGSLGGGAEKEAERE